MATTSAVAVRLVGMREMLAALQQVGNGADRIIRTELLVTAGAIAATLRGILPHDSGDAAGSVTAGMDKKGAWISAGSGIPYYPWLDFGGSTKRWPASGSMQAPISRQWLGKPGGEGRYMYPAIRQHRQDILVAIDAGVALAAKEAGFETSGGLS